jgi:ribosomal silencing factor RsfS
VFDLEDLLELLKLDNAKDICVIRLPPELKYVEYMVIVTGKSRRHIIGLAEFVRKVFKKKCNKTDIIPKIEGENCSKWSALDLGELE